MASTNTTTTQELGIDYSFIAYVLFAVLIGLGAAYYAVKNQKTILAIAIVISSIAIFWFFGSRWFNGFKLKQDMAGGVDRTITWPPQVNYCPDFLSLKVQTSGSTTTYYCVDTMGLTGLTPFTEGSTLTALGTSGATTYNALKLLETYDATSKSTLKTNLDVNKMTWEGIYDGSSFSGLPIPTPYPATT
jgi:hypothetical protein